MSIAALFQVALRDAILGACTYASALDLYFAIQCLDLRVLLCPMVKHHAMKMCRGVEVKLKCNYI
jgi:hypothetical protein